MVYTNRQHTLSHLSNPLAGINVCHCSVHALQVLKPGGSFINMVDVTLFPASDRMVGALVKFAPGAIRQLHWHTTLDEVRPADELDGLLQHTPMPAAHTWLQTCFC